MRRASRAAGTAEVEWQFEAVDLRLVERWLNDEGSIEAPATLEPLGTRRIRDTYLDTDDWRLHRAGYTLRSRAANGEHELTLKSRADAIDGVRTRLELTQKLGEVGDEAHWRGGPVVDRVRLLVGRNELISLFRVNTRRQAYALQLGGADGAPSAELALDDTSIPVSDGGQPVRLQRVEVELAGAARKRQLLPFVRRIRAESHLRPAITSKFEAGLLANGLRPVDLQDLGRTDGGPLVHDVAYSFLRTHFVRFLEQEGSARLGDDLEGVHQMRIAVRRLRAAAQLFAPYLPHRFGFYQRELRWVAAALGTVRDLDVQLLQLADWMADMDPADAEGLQPLADLLQRRRRRARTRLLRTLNSRRYSRLVAGLTDALRRGPTRRTPGRGVLIAAFAPSIIERRHRRVMREGARLKPSSPPAEFHQLRIRCKRLRYTLECLEDVYPRHMPRVLRRLAAVQDVLGMHQDADVAVAHLRALIDEHATEFSPRALFVLGRITERYDRQAIDLRRQLPKVFRRLDGRAWARLQREMRAQLPKVEPTPESKAKPEPEVEAGPEAEAEPAPETEVEPAPETEVEPAPERAPLSDAASPSLAVAADNSPSHVT
jgi:triphosphatase